MISISFGMGRGTNTADTRLKQTNILTVTVVTSEKVASARRDVSSLPDASTMEK